MHGQTESKTMKRPTNAALIGALALTATIGAIGWNNAAHATRTVGVETGNLASIDVFALVDRALSTDEMTTQRAEYETATNAQMEQVQQQLMALQTQLSNMTPDDQNAQALYQQYQTLQNQAQYQSQEATTGYQRLIANQIAGAYQEIYAAANEIAAEEGYDFVFATRADGELLQTDTITGITQEILARPLVTPPTATDLTEQLRVRLGYPEDAPEGEADSGLIDPSNGGVEDAQSEEPAENAEPTSGEEGGEE